MENKNAKRIREREHRRRIGEHRKRKLAEFEKLSRTWIPEEYRADPILANPPVKALAYFMMVDWLMSTGNVAEVNEFIDYMVSGLARVARLEEKDIANN
jgi:hypothetical protein